MKRPLLISLVAGVAMTVAGAAIAQDLTFRFNDGEVDAMRAALDKFEAENPGVSVELQTIAWSESRQQFLREAAVGEGPDVVHIAFVWPRDMGAAGALLPINDMLESDPIQGGFDDFIATELAVGADGNIYGVPWTTDTWAMIYRTDVLEEAGIDTIPTTWEELRDASRTIHEKTGKVGFGFPAGSGSQNTLWFLANYYWWSNGDALVVADGDSFKDRHHGRQDRRSDGVLSFLHHRRAQSGSHAWCHRVVRPGHPRRYDQRGTGYRHRSAPAGQGDPGGLRRTQSRRRATFRHLTTPGGPEGPKTHLGGRMLGINANTENPDLAWKLVEFMTRPDILAEHYGNQFPAQKTALAEAEFGPALAGFAAQLPLARSWGAYSDGPAQIGTMWNDTGRASAPPFIGEVVTTRRRPNCWPRWKSN